MSKTKKVNTTIKIKADSENSAAVFFSILNQNFAGFSKELKREWAQRGYGESDPSFENIDAEKLTAELRLKPTDKGDVFILDGNGEISAINYPELEDREVYGMIESGRVTVYQRVFDDDQFDRPLGGAINLAFLKQTLKEAPAILEDQEKKYLAQKKEAEEQQEKEASEVELKVVK